MLLLLSTFSNSPKAMAVRTAPGFAPDLKTNLNSPLSLGFNTELFRQPLAALPCPRSPALTLAQSTRGLQKLPVASHTFSGIVIYHFQGFIGVGVTLCDLFDALHVVLEEKG